MCSSRGSGKSTRLPHALSLTRCALFHSLSRALFHSLSVSLPSTHTGKTTLLRHLLEKSGLKIGCVVNDVASVNIDAKLVRNDRAREKKDNKDAAGGERGTGADGVATTTTADLADTVELANGCACAFSGKREGEEKRGWLRTRRALLTTHALMFPFLSFILYRLLHSGRALRLL